MIWFFNLVLDSYIWILIYIFFETSEDDIETVVAKTTGKQQYHMRDDEIEEYTKIWPEKKYHKFFSNSPLQ